MAVQAIASGVRMSSRKVGEVAALVRGRTVADALVILEHTPRRAAQPIAKVIKSAQANAKQNHKLDPAQLTLSSIEVGPGTPLKRFRPAAHGRALKFHRHSCNIRVIVDGPEKVSRAAKTAPKKDEPTTEEETK